MTGGRDERRIEREARGEEMKEEKRWKRTEVSKRSFKRGINHFDSLCLSAMHAHTQTQSVTVQKLCVIISMMITRVRLPPIWGIFSMLRWRKQKIFKIFITPFRFVAKPKRPRSGVSHTQLVKK